MEPGVDHGERIGGPCAAPPKREQRIPDSPCFGQPTRAREQEPVMRIGVPWVAVSCGPQRVARLLPQFAAAETLRPDPGDACRGYLQFPQQVELAHRLVA